MHAQLQSWFYWVKKMDFGDSKIHADFREPLRQPKNYRLNFEVTLRGNDSTKHYELLIKGSTNRVPVYNSSRIYYGNIYATFDSCVARLHLRSTQGKSIIKWIHLECDIGNAMKEKLDIAPTVSIIDPYFLSETEIPSLFNVGGDNTFCEVAVFGRLKLISDQKILPEYTIVGLEASCLGKPQIHESLLYDRDSTASELITVVITSGGQEQELKVRRDFVIGRSSEFEKMLRSDTVEMPMKNIITVKNVDYETMKNFLAVLDPDENQDELFELPMSKWLDILAVSRKYKTRTAFHLCMMVIMSVRDKKLNMIDISAMYKAATKYEIPDLRYRCLKWMKKEYSTLEGKLAIDGFLKGADHHCLLEVTQYLLSSTN